MTSFKYLYFTTFITDICVSTLFIYTLQGNSPYAPTSVGTNSEKIILGNTTTVALAIESRMVCLAVSNKRSTWA